jgi:hypothetical protein
MSRTLIRDKCLPPGKGGNEILEKGNLPNINSKSKSNVKLKKLKSGQVPTKGCRAIDRQTEGKCKVVPVLN